MNELTLEILASDIKETDYIDSRDCAITRALARAGRPDLRDAGTDIQSEFGEVLMELDKNVSYTALSTKVVNMYSGVKPEDFTHILTY